VANQSARALGAVNPSREGFANRAHGTENGGEGKAEGEGFEPSADGTAGTVFETTLGSLNHAAQHCPRDSCRPSD